jgi:hypothetical protein
MLENSAEKAVVNTISSAIYVACTIPVISPFCEATNLGSIVIGSGLSAANAFMTGIGALSKVISVLADVVGKRASVIKTGADAFNRLNNSFSSVQNIMNESGKLVDRADQTVQRQIEYYQNSVPTSSVVSIAKTPQITNTNIDELPEPEIPSQITTST